MMWNVHSSALANTWSIVEPIVTVKKIILPPEILSKIIAEVMAVETSDKKNVYRIIFQQLKYLSIENWNIMNFQLLNDFIRKIAQEGLHVEEEVLRDKMNMVYFNSFCLVSPLMLPDCSPLRRTQSLTNLTSTSSKFNFQVNKKVYEEEKIVASIIRALQCSNYNSVIQIIINCLKKQFLDKILLSIYKYIMDQHPHSTLMNLLRKIEECKLLIFILKEMFYIFISIHSR